MYESCDTGMPLDTGSASSAPSARMASRGVWAESWDRVKRRLRAELGEDVFTSWFGRLDLDAVEDGVAQVTVPTRFLKSWIEAHYSDRVLAVLSEECETVRRISIGVRSASVREHGTGAKASAESTRPAPILVDSSPAPVVRLTRPSSHDNERGELTGNAIDTRLTFDSFLIGKANALAHAAAQRVADSDAGPALYNPLYLHAGVGLGKTHLAQAIANAAQTKGRRVIYLTADRFMYGFVAALKSQSALAFKEQLRSIDILVIDDVQFIQGKSIPQEFGHTINALIDAGKQVVVAADRPPGDLDSFDERVRSRLAGGLVVEIGSLDENLRVQILTSRLAAMRKSHPSFEVPAAVIQFVAHSITTNARDLDGAANRLLAHATLTGGPLTVETAEAAIRDLIRTRDPKRVKIEDIQKLVASRYNVSRSDILSERRTASVVRPRQIAMYLSKVLTLRSLPEIGRRFGGRDHTTVLHAVRKIEKEVEADMSLQEELELLKRMLQE